MQRKTRTLLIISTKPKLNWKILKNWIKKIVAIYETVGEIFTLLSDNFDDNKIIIKKIGYSKLELETTLKVSRSKELSLSLCLYRKECSTNDTVKILCENITALKNENTKLKDENKKLQEENKNINERVNKIENLMNEMDSVPEFLLNKFSMVVSYQGKYYATPKTNNWTYTSNQIGVNLLTAVISINMTNNITIFNGTTAPAKSYYIALQF